MILAMVQTVESFRCDMTDAEKLKHRDATREEVEASRMIANALEAFMGIAGRRSIEWIDEGREAFAPDYWYFMFIMHCLESIRMQHGGKMEEGMRKGLCDLADNAAAGVPLMVVNKTGATHKAPGRVQ